MIPGSRTLNVHAYANAREGKLWEQLYRSRLLTITRGRGKPSTGGCPMAARSAAVTKTFGRLRPTVGCCGYASSSRSALVIRTRGRCRGSTSLVTTPVARWPLRGTMGAERCESTQPKLLANLDNVSSLITSISASEIAMRLLTTATCSLRLGLLTSAARGAVPCCSHVQAFTAVFGPAEPVINFTLLAVPGISVFHLVKVSAHRPSTLNIQATSMTVQIIGILMYSYKLQITYH